MRNLLQFFTRSIAPAAPKPSFNDMLTQVFKAQGYARVAESEPVLNQIERWAEKINDWYKSIPETAGHVNKIHEVILTRRCELLARQYPKNEEA